MGRSFGEGLEWHLIHWGTRPYRADKKGEAWAIWKFAAAVHGESLAGRVDDEFDTETKRVLRWRQGLRHPKHAEVTRVLELLFGEDENLSDWKNDLEGALTRPVVRSPFLPPKRVVGPEVAVTGVKVVDSADKLTTVPSGQPPFKHCQLHQEQAKPTSLVELLRADRRATTLVGRTNELAMIDDWLNSPQGVAVKCIVGDTGSGKTRLAIEGCARAEAAGWFATFLSNDEMLTIHDKPDFKNWRQTKPTLIVIDNAAASTSSLKCFLNELAQISAKPLHKIRVLLLERHADHQSGWWASLLRPDSLTLACAADLVFKDMPYMLHPLYIIHDVRKLFNETMIKLEYMSGVQHSPAERSKRSAMYWLDLNYAQGFIRDNPIYVMMRGIIAVGSDDFSKSKNQQNLAQWIATVEAARLKSFAIAKGFKDEGKFLQHIAACVTLQGGCHRLELTSIVSEERQALCAVLPFDDEAVADIMGDFLPLSTRLEGIQPPLIGECFWLEIFEYSGFHTDAAKQAMVLRCWQRSPVGTGDTLIRCACDLTEYRQANHASIKFLRLIIEACGDYKKLRDLCEAIPRVMELSEFAHEISLKIIDCLNAMTDSRCETFASDLAIAYNNAAGSAARLGRDEETKVMFDRACAICRELLADKADELLPKLAVMHRNLAVSLGQLGRHDEALDEAEKAVTLWYEMAAERPDADTSKLPMALNTVAICLSELGRHEDGLIMSEKALSLCRQLATEQVDGFAHTLGIVLANFAVSLGKLGQGERALAMDAEALVLYRQLAATEPDAFTPDLITALNNVACRLCGLGRREEAVEIAEQAVPLYIQLITIQPGIDISKLSDPLLIIMDILDKRELFRWYHKFIARRPECSIHIAFMFGKN